MTMCPLSASQSSSLRIALDPSSSLGFGGVPPAARTVRLGSDSTCCATSA